MLFLQNIILFKQFIFAKI